VRKVLVVSDNVELVSFFKVVTEGIQARVAEFDYCYSIINKAPDELKKIGMSVVDMKDQLNINSIISNYDLVISAHCKQIFPNDLVKAVRCINIHPGLNPYNRGWYPQVFSIINKKPIGCTVHLMDDEIDHGDVIYQKVVDINSWDTSEAVYKRVVSSEKELIKLHLLDLVNEAYDCKKLEHDGNYNGIKDFDELTFLDLTSKGSLAEHVDLLRALTHGSFNNAFFVDEQGNRVFVKIALEKEK